MGQGDWTLETAPSGKGIIKAHSTLSNNFLHTLNINKHDNVDKPWAKHNKAHHTGCTEPKIGMKIVARASTTNERKIKEARVILKKNSDLNDKKEQMDLRRFLA